MISWLTPTLSILPKKSEFPGNIKWNPASLMSQTLIWAWQDSRHVTDAFSATQVVCANLMLERVANAHTAFLNAPNRPMNRQLAAPRLRDRW
jgi:hypothetical protein